MTVLEGQMREAQAAAQGLEKALDISEQRANELQRDLAAQAVAALALTQQRGAAEARAQAAGERLDAERSAAAKEREELQALLMQVENRAYTEVDRVRQELKAVGVQLTTQAREHATALRASEQARRQAEGAAAKAQREAAALQTQLARAIAKAAPIKRRASKPAKRKATLASSTAGSPD